VSRWVVSPQDDSAALLGTVEELRHAREEIEQLKVALISRQMIGVAQGMLMLRYGLGLDRSFEYLSRRSQNENIKLRLLAERVIAELSAEGPGQP
jgi:AmiR/NasT family two-component response regulator